MLFAGNHRELDRIHRVKENKPDSQRQMLHVSLMWNVEEKKDTKIEEGGDRDEGVREENEWGECDQYM
jgi:hypothetical protein